MADKGTRSKSNFTSEQNTESFAEYISHLAVDLSRLLADPRQYPVIVVHGDSSSSVALLYRILPIVALHAYSPHGGNVRDTEATESKTTAEENDATFRPSVVRLVTHEGAFHTPQDCADGETFVDVLPALHHSGEHPSAAPETATEYDAPDETVRPAGPSTATAADESRRTSTQAFTAKFLHYLQSKDPFGAGKRSSLSGNGEATELPSTLTGPTSQWANDEGPTSIEGSAVHDGEESVHWVVPLWLGVHPSDLHNVLREWRTVLCGSLRYETATLVLFVNTEFASDWLEMGARASATSRMRRGKGDSVSSSGSCGPSSVYWREFTSASRLAYSLLRVARNTPLQQKLRGVTETGGVSVGANATSVQPTGRYVHDDLHELSTSDLSGVRLPCLSCRRDMETSFSFRGSILKGIFRTVKELTSSVYWCCLARSASKVDQVRRRKRALAVHTAVLFPSWQWLLPFGRPHAPAHVPAALPMSSPPHTAAAAAAPIFPYILVSDAAAQDAELKRAVRRNAINAATLRLMNAAAGVCQNVRNDAAADLLHPTPRYYAPFVADGGPPLTLDGCLADIFVLEFMPDCARGREWESWASWLQRHPPNQHAGVSQRRRYDASLRLVKATEAFVATPLPNRAVTTALLKAVMRLLSDFGKGRGVMSWPLLDAREGHRHPRVAFTMTYEFFAPPFTYAAHSYERGGAAVADGASVESQFNSSTNGSHVSPNTGLTITPVTKVGASHGASFPTATVASAPPATPWLPYDLSLVHSVTSLLARLRSFGWVLVWQEDHRRWPTAVAPPCMYEKDSASFSHNFRGGSTETAAGSGTGEGPTTANGLPVSSTALQKRVSSLLEEWRQEQRQRHDVRYDMDPATRPSRLRAFFPALDRMLAEDATLSQNLERGLHSPLFPSPYTSLDVWQAAMVPEEAGMYLLEGQTVFLDNGQCGTIVDFKPPSPKLFLPWASHPTKEEQRLWRAQQQRHAAFLRFYRWRRRLHANNAPSRHLAAAYTALPSYVTLREQDVYPVVRVSSPASGDRSIHRTQSSSGPSTSSPPSAFTEASSEGMLVHLLPTRVDTIPVKYPTTCVLTVQEQESWYEAHPRVSRPPYPLRNMAWQLTLTGHRRVSQVTLLSLPLSPHRVETSASFFMAQIFSIAQRPLRCHRLPFSLTKDLMPCDVSAVDRLGEQWAHLHHNARKKNALLSLAAIPFSHKAHEVPFGYIRWASFFQKK